MKAVVGLLLVAGLLYFGVSTEAPSPENPWLAYALNRRTGKLEWASLAASKTLDECRFNADKAVAGGFYQAPSGCLYMGYQNAYVQWVVNSILGQGMFKCIARSNSREKYTDPVLSPVLRDFPADHGDNWTCAL